MQRYAVNRRPPRPALFWWTCLCVVPMALVAPTGCRERGDADSSGQRGAAASGAASPSLPASETTLASNVIPTDEILWALGPGVRERVVAVSSLADDPRYSQVAGRWPKGVQRLGTNPEEVLALGPGVVFVASFSSPEYRAALDGQAKVVVLDGFDGFDGYRRSLTAVGEAIGEVEACARLAAEFESRREEIARSAPTQGPTCLAWNEGYVPGAKTTFHDVAKTAGCRPLAAERGIEGHQPIDLEQIIAWDPDVLVVSCEGDCERRRARLESRPGLADLRALKSGQVALIDDAQIGSVGAGMLDFAASLQAQLPPSAGAD